VGEVFAETLTTSSKSPPKRCAVKRFVKKSRAIPVAFALNHIVASQKCLQVRLIWLSTSNASVGYLFCNMLIFSAGKSPPK